MDYEHNLKALKAAWIAFDNELIEQGIGVDQLLYFHVHMDRKDVHNAVTDCIMEATR